RVQTVAAGGQSVRRPPAASGLQSRFEYPATIPARKHVVLDLPLPNGRISGRVRDTDGSPATGARVSLRAETPVPGTTLAGQMSELTTDEHGRFDIQSLRAGLCTLHAGG